MNTYRNLILWQKAMDLAAATYALSKTYPRVEIYGLVAQSRRSCVSIPSNVAEAYGRRTNGERIHFLGVARGSLHELETQLLLAMRFEFGDRQEIENTLLLSAEVGRILNGLMRSLHPTDLTTDN